MDKKIHIDWENEYKGNSSAGLSEERSAIECLKNLLNSAIKIKEAFE